MGRLSIRVAGALLVLLGCLPGHILARLTRRRPSPWIRRFLALVGDAFAIDVRVVGEPRRCDVLYAANHVSWIDIVAIGGATGAAFVSKEEVARWPLVGWLARQAETVFIRRETRGAVKAQADTLGAALASGRAAALFPEGTTNDGTALLPFRASLFAAVEQAPAGVRVQPVAIDYGAVAGAVVWPDQEPAGINAKRILSTLPRIPVTLHFLPPIDPAACGGRKAIALAAHDAIEAVLFSAPRL